MKTLGRALLAAALSTGAAAQDLSLEAMPNAVGRISYGATIAPGEAICTGTLVAPDLVLTAAHCVRGADARPGSIRFAAGLHDGTSLAVARGAEVLLAAGEGPERDVALVRLTAAMPAVITPLPLGAESGPRLTRFGYRRDRPDTADREDLCLILQDDGAALRVGCSAVSGHSGAALLSIVDGGWRVAAVTVARVTGGFGSIALRVPPDLAVVIAAAQTGTKPAADP